MAALRVHDEPHFNRTREGFWDLRPRRRETYYGFTRRAMAFYDRHHVGVDSFKTKMVKDLVLIVAPNIPVGLKRKIRNPSITLEHLPMFIQTHMALLRHPRIFKTKDPNEIAEEFYRRQDTSKIMCFRCRWRGHKSKHCTAIPYCSLCQHLGHTNREHRAFVSKLSTRNQQVTPQEIRALEIALEKLSLLTSYATQQIQDRGQKNDKTGRAPPHRSSAPTAD